MRRQHLLSALNPALLLPITLKFHISCNGLSFLCTFLLRDNGWFSFSAPLGRDMESGQTGKGFPRLWVHILTVLWIRYCFLGVSRVGFRQPNPFFSRVPEVNRVYILQSLFCQTQHKHCRVFRFIIIFWVTARIGLHILMLKNTWISCLFKAHLLNTQSALTGQLTHAWASTGNNNRAAMLNQFLHAKLPRRHKSCKWMSCWHSVMSWSHRIKGGVTFEAFQEQCFLWERGASVGAHFELFNFQDVFMHKNLHKNTEGMEKNGKA